MKYSVPSYAFRARARAAMKPVMSVLIVVALIATLPSILSSSLTMLTGASPDQVLTNFSNRTMQVKEKYGLDASTDELPAGIDENALAADVLRVYDTFYTESETFVREKGPIVIALTVMTILLSPVLQLGLISALLHALRRQEFSVAIVFSRLRIYPKALGLTLLLGLKYLMWMLPGIAVMVLGFFLPAEASLLVMLLGMAAMIVPVIPAVYRYAMATYILADAPETGVLACIRRSKEIMQGRKMELFSLELSFIGWGLLAIYAEALLTGMLGTVLGMTLGQFASLLVTVYTQCSIAAFYQEYAVGPLPSAEAPTSEMTE
jgi:uncharacterized membrane protein